MNEILKNALEPNEKILWTSKIEKIETLDATNKQPFVKKSIVCLTLAVILIAGYLYMCIPREVEVKPAIIAIIVIFVGYAPLCTFLDAAKLKRGFLYAASDKRLLLVDSRVKSMEYDLIKDAAIKTDADGHVSLLCGKKTVNSAPHKWRAAAIYGQESDRVAEEGACDIFGFYAIENPEGLAEVLKSKGVPLA